MTQKTWDDVEISAYIDDQLDPEARVALEAAMQRDEALRCRVEDLRAMVQRVRAVPLREPPRNYLLTPSMVAETAPAPPKRRRRPLRVMRWATSLAAAAFALSMVFNLWGSALMPGAMLSQPAPQAQRVVEEMAVEKEVEEPAPMVQMAAEDEPTEDELQEQREDMELAPLPEDGGAQGVGQGGGSDAGVPEAAPVSETPSGTPAPMGTPLPPTTATTEDLTEDETVPGSPKLPEGDGSSTVTDTMQSEPPPDVWVPPEPPAPPPVRPSVWVSWGLGALTLVLAVATFWLSRQR